MTTSLDLTLRIWNMRTLQETYKLEIGVAPLGARLIHKERTAEQRGHWEQHFPCNPMAARHPYQPDRRRRAHVSAWPGLRDACDADDARAE